MTNQSREREDPYLEHAAFLRRLAHSLRLDPDLAEDALQETWLAARLHPPRHRLNIRGWLATLLRNAARKLSRADRRRAHREALIARRNGSASHEVPFAWDPMLAAVEVALKGLRQPYRETLILRFYDDLPPREIARTLGVPVETVRTRVRRGLGELRAGLPPTPRRRWNSNALILLLCGRPLRCAAALALFGALTTSMLAFGGSSPVRPRIAAPSPFLPPAADVDPLGQPPQGMHREAPHGSIQVGILQLGGQVIDDSGTALAGIAVGCFPLGWSAPSVLPCETVRSREDGTFELLAAHRGEHLLVALAQDCRPAWVVATPGELHALVCERGLAVEGHAPSVAAGLPVEIRAEEGGTRLILDGEELIWNGERVRRSHLRSRVRPSGHFGFAGLSSGPHRLEGPPLPDRIVFPPLRGVEWRMR